MAALEHTNIKCKGYQGQFDTVAVENAGRVIISPLCVPESRVNVFCRVQAKQRVHTGESFGMPRRMYLVWISSAVVATAFVASSAVPPRLRTRDPWMQQDLSSHGPPIV